MTSRRGDGNALQSNARRIRTGPLPDLAAYSASPITTITTSSRALDMLWQMLQSRWARVKIRVSRYGLRPLPKILVIVLLVSLQSKVTKATQQITNHTHTHARMRRGFRHSSTSRRWPLHLVVHRRPARAGICQVSCRGIDVLR